jgi:hypothetical protein
MKPSVPIEDDEYTTVVTRLRIFDEGDGWALDGADDVGRYTEAIWKFDTHEEAVAQQPAFIDWLIKTGIKVRWRKDRRQHKSRIRVIKDEEDHDTVFEVTGAARRLNTNARNQTNAITFAQAIELANAWAA